MGRPSQTKYHFQDSAGRIKVTRPHHPLQDQELEVLNSGKQTLVVRLKDGSSMRIPRAWTDVDATPINAVKQGSEIFTVASLRALIELVSALKERY